MLAHYLFSMPGADSLAYLTVEGLTTAVTSNIDSKDKKMIGHCTACLTGIIVFPLILINFISPV